MRARRSSVVIGFARPRIDASDAMLGGRGPALDWPPRARWAERRAADNPPAAAVTHRNERLESIGIPPIAAARN